MTAELTPEFVEFIPEVLEDGRLYISQIYATAVHKCCCGCGLKVITPLSPTGWRLTVDGNFVSLDPSIGNWGYPCKSHYWIRRNAVQWSYEMTPEEIEAGRRYDAQVKERYFNTAERRPEPEPAAHPVEADAGGADLSFWQRLKQWFFG